MSYSDFYLKSRNKPPVVLYVLAFLAVGGFVATFFKPPTPTVKASKESVVYHTLANLSTHQASIYYQTANPTKSWIIYGTDVNSLDHAAFDDRDTQDHKSSYNLHFVQLKDLRESTTYSYKIIADGKVVEINGSSSFSFITPATTALTSDASSINPAYGKVIQPNSEPVNNGFVLYYYPEAYPLITSIQGGDWLISLTSLINRHTGKVIVPEPSETVKIEMIDENLKSTTIETQLSNTVPLSKTVIIGTDYSQNRQEGVLGTQNSVTASPKPTIVVQQAVKTGPIEITFPKDKAIVPGNNPLIKGKAIAGSVVNLSLRTAQHTILATKITTDSAGEWQLNLPMPLQPALHTLTITTKDSSGKMVTITRSFTTIKSGEEVVLGEATTEATIAPTQPVATPTFVLAQVSPTLVPTVAATATPISTVTPPVTGDNTVYIMLGSLILVIIGGAAILLI